ncbi:MAG TPA: hypothetical protein V6D29_19840 [Leptolyngbyaceae cyanobacterium]
MTLVADYSQFAKDFNRYLSLARRQQKPLSLLLLAIPLTAASTNATLAGRLAQALRYQVRQEDLVGCWENRWISIALYGSPRNTTEQRLHHLSSQDDWWQAGDRTLEVTQTTVGKGLAIFPEDGEDFLTLLHLAQQQCV